MSIIPVKSNTIALTTLAMIAAVGIVVRYAVQIPIIPNAVVLTPGFMFSILAGIVGGIPGGAIVGAIIGASGALSGTEMPLLPMFGNICLGIGSGYAIYFANRDDAKYYALVILGSGLIGGFMPTITVFSSFVDPFIINLIAASIDMIQAFLWAVIGLFIEKTIIRPIAGQYLYSDGKIRELSEKEV
ncbi:MAG: hypothetical protein AM325_002615 [Candidatus Thorarchaeota archaeon SMTZ1-45]|nr:MAG: hypothetical protein AM325_04415 [Candidatus Thorarchaeota archaeon SMTZ1-45]